LRSTRTQAEQFTTACPRNCYSTCSIRVEVEDGRLRRILPLEENRATPEGACLKGLSYVEREHSPQRILHPLRRDERGEFQRIGWPEALDEIAARLIDIRERHGPKSVFYYNGSGTKGLLNSVGSTFFRLFGGYTTTYGDLCWPAGLEASRLTLGDNKHNAPWDLVNARLLVLWGKNSAETNIHQMPFVEQALRDGARLIVIDPRRTETAERAELLLQPRPGTDGALALAIAHVLFRDDHVEREFVDRHVLGCEPFAERVRACTPEWAARITGVPAGFIERVATAVGTVKPATICAGFGMQRYTNSGQTMRSMIALLALTGNIGRPGAGWQFANLQSAIFDAVQDPVAFYPPAQPDGVARVSVSTSRLGRDMLATKDPPLKMMWVERGNPVTQNPDTNRVLEAVRSLDFRVVVEQFLTDTAREADIVLPAKTMFEQSDVIGAYWHPYIQLKQKVLPPPGEVKPESEIYRLLAERLELDREAVAQALPGPRDEDVDAWLEARLAPFPELSLARLRQGPVLAPGHQEIAFSDLEFATPSGKIELWSDEARQRWGVDPLPEWSEAEESTRGAATPAGEYPLHFMTPNTKNRIHSQFNNLEMIRALGEQPLLAICPVDAVARRIENGDRVRVFNERGSLEVEARIELGLRSGCVSMTNGWWISEGGTVNFLSAGRETDMGHGAAFHDNLVQVERAGK
jgi:anaerobic selenocysteine-containing dehydrogenase